MLLAAAACSSSGEPPAPDPGPTGDAPAVTLVTPRTGPTGETVRVEARGFPTGRELDIGFGPPASEYEVLGSVEARSDGTVAGTFEVPDWAQADQAYLVVVADGFMGPRAVSEAFHVTGTDGVITVAGRITTGGIECPLIQTIDGSVYTLLGDGAREVPPGTDIRVSGKVAEASFCMQGIPIDVSTIERLD